MTTPVTCNVRSKKIIYQTVRVEPHIKTYKKSISRGNLKKGIYEPLAVSVVRETPLDEYGKERFYRPAVLLLDKIYSDPIAKMQ